MTTAGTTADGTTGRYLVLLEDDWDGAAGELNRVAGIQAVDSAEAGVTDPLWEADGLVLRELGVALVTADADQVTALTSATVEPGAIALVEPERTVHALATPTAPAPAPGLMDETMFTWGLQAVGAPDSRATGAGVRVAVLDTGLDLEHPDLAGRTIESSSFVQGQQVQDGHGHGTHCVGTACGPREPGDGPGYGVAYEADIHAGKVLSDEGSGADGGILSGISWAITNGCRVVSMSLGAATTPGQAYSRTYERVARRALARGTLIIAAAGNESKRGAGHVAPVGHPANCPSIMAVGAVDVATEIANFSCGTVDTIGGVDVVGPGVDVYSSWPMPTRYRRISGTSMATPHVSGIAALISQVTGAAGYDLWARLCQTARRLPLPSTDVGSGLVQAP
ncbi:S8 family serine peptidase [Actinophytocola gossypii]|uniref:S8 family serine peptidase n=1 Tax=Actinophytocola gossypii TaxID=2812003 RepID=A0ABT2J6U7_9PSEU|nr:S8 family serine peptidase [Actinophytocola gossypii]MCT2583587.1 S8 family serine peptidase [Actinophytocola gossypii]